MSSTTWFIYALKDPRTDDVRYVGRTTNLSRRKGLHVWNARNRPDETRTNWIAELLAEGLRPTMETLETGAGAGYEEAEIHWISTYRARGFNLTNKTDGGDGFAGLVISEPMRAKLKAARAKREPHSETTRALISAGNTGQRRSAEFCERMAAKAKLQAPPSAAAREKMAAAHRNPTPEHRAKLSAAHKGKPLSEAAKVAAKARGERQRGRKVPREVVERIAAKQRGRVLSEEHKEKLKTARAARKPITEETRAKMSASQRARGPRSKEFCEKMRKQASNPSEETRAKLRAAVKRRAPISEETRAKIANALRAHFANKPRTQGEE